MLTTKDVFWVAGLLEGEGCFVFGRNGVSPQIQLCMTDLDVVIRAAEILGVPRVCENKIRTPGGKPNYRLNVYGTNAISWLMTLLPLMGERRSERITECITRWVHKNTNYPGDRKSSPRGGKVVWSREVEVIL